MKKIIEDKRPIKRLYIKGNTCYSIIAGGEFCDSIEAYEENGELAPVTWFAIIKDGIVAFRINGHYVQEVSY